MVYFTPRPKWLSAWISSSLTLVIHLPGMNDIESTAISPSNDGPRIPSMEICNENNPTLMSQKAVGLFEWKVRAFLDQILLFCKAHLIKCPKQIKLCYHPIFALVAYSVPNHSRPWSFFNYLMNSQSADSRPHHVILEPHALSPSQVTT